MKKKSSSRRTSRRRGGSLLKRLATVAATGTKKELKKQGKSYLSKYIKGGSCGGKCREKGKKKGSKRRGGAYIGGGARKGGLSEYQRFMSVTLNKLKNHSSMKDYAPTDRFRAAVSMWHHKK